MNRFVDDNRIVFDLGMNNGDDTAFYLARDFSVISVEANPFLCDSAMRRFSTPIGDGRLKIVNAAVSESVGTATFFINMDNDHWSSLDIDWANRESSTCKQVQVRCVTLNYLFAQFGVPYFLKIDIEGADNIVLDQLQNCDVLPRCVSVEDCRFGFLYMETLASCGYDGFKLLDQSSVDQITDPITGHAFPAGSSGPFGNDVPGEWLSYQDMVELYSKTVRDQSGNRLAPRTHWWDIHCTKRM